MFEVFGGLGNSFSGLCRRRMHRFVQGRHTLRVTCFAIFGLGLHLGYFVVLRFC